MHMYDDKVLLTQAYFKEIFAQLRSENAGVRLFHFKVSFLLQPEYL
jgi:hypothetical protein